MASAEPCESSAAIRERVEVVRLIQSERFAGQSKVRCNARMSSKMVCTVCTLDKEGEGMLEMAMTQSR